MFQTKVEIPDSLVKISYQDKIMSFGSCFAENMGGKLEHSFFDVDKNPFGVLYNPVSIKNSLELLIHKSEFKCDDVFENRGLWQSFSHSSLFSDISKEACLEKINSRFVKAKKTLSDTRIILITFGTAWVYENKESGSVVSNCHKLPSYNFERKRISVEQIVSDYSVLIENLLSNFPEMKFIFSVSPIRHWKDGPHENNISKSILLLAIEQLQKHFNQVLYFPAYEIQLDELRDYRFYASDMLHPSTVAVDYIWERFASTFFADETKGLMKRLNQLRADLNHIPLFPALDEYNSFIKNIERQKLYLFKNYPYLCGRF